MTMNSGNCFKTLIFFIFFLQIFIFAYLIKEVYISLFVIIAEIMIFAYVKDLEFNRVIEVRDNLSGQELARSNRSEVIDLTYKDVTDEEKNNFDFCSICLDDEKDSIVKLNCDHFFHKDCIKSWLRREMSCPICRSNASLV